MKILKIIFFKTRWDLNIQRAIALLSHLHVKETGEE